MKVLHIGVFGVVLLAGCNTLGLGDKRVDYRAGAEQVPALEIPPDLTAPGRDERYRVPQGDGETVATYSDYSKAGASVQSRRASTVLPEAKNVSLERNGAQRWLVVKDKPENVWFEVKAFLQETGWPIKSEDQAAGIIETDWAESRTNIPRSWFGKLLNKINSTGERDQYRVRLERGKDGESTEVYITHRGMESSIDVDNSKWQARPNDPELERIMLQRLMVRLGGNEAASSAVADSVPSGAAAMREASDGSMVMVMNDAFDRSWRRVGLAIERAGWVVEDKDRVKGIYFLQPAKTESGWLDKLQFWKDTNSNTRYRVNVKDGGKACEVFITDQDGASDSTTNLMIDALYKNTDHGEVVRNGEAAKAAMQAQTSSIRSTGLAGTASLQEIFDGSSIIVLNDTFDQSWRKVGVAIERAGLAVESNDRSKGVYFLKPAKEESGWLDKLQFWKDGKAADVRYRVNVKDGGKACEVSVTDQNGVSDSSGKKMVESIYKNINQ